ncbi:hypothetical protein STIUS_v1c02530 [Spiroplasma sp. TIUS-1]|uniref:hypothetical protein n=1 Tax=Spiroplasma sp. TIUS-1 TaxID=216963 RepID=UPI0013977254|nr:hypothetical protein [Spiroplasma sp. TIUS-1]QHX35807.1 hypothetical protein STIUS_v1c02530 [Spiroplasma sp. TIUS-1]
MGKKPGSWKKINKLTGKVKVVSNNTKYRIGIFSFIFIAGITSFGVSSYFFMSKIINYGGIKTTGKFPNWNLKKGNGFEVDFAKAPINHIGNDVTELQSKDIYDDEGNFQYREFNAPSLRLQYAYNEIVNKAAANYISKNIFYSVMYPDDKKVEILNIYTDENKKNKLNLDDVSANNFDILDCVLFLEIKYDGVLVNKAVMMPTIFYGNEGFLSNFLQFNLLNNLHKNGDKENLHPINQTSIIGSQSDSILMDIKNGDYDNDKNRKNTDKLYETYAEVFDEFFKENKDKEFKSTDINPYSNFIISGANTQDKILVNETPIVIDDTKDLLDINQIFALGSGLSEDDSSEAISNAIGLESVKHLKAFFLFFKNIYINEGSSFAFDKDYFKETIFESLFKDIGNRYVTTSLEQNYGTDQFYFMFLPEDLEVQELLNNLRTEIIGILNGAASGNGENIGDLLLKTFENIKKDLLKNGKNSKHWWLFKNDFLPFQSYWISESKDYEVTKQRIQHETTLSSIDKPNLNEIIIKDSANYDLTKSDDKVRVFSDLWSTSLYGKDLNKLNLNMGNEDEIKELWLNNTNKFLYEINKLNININKNAISLEEWQEQFEIKLQYLNQFNKPTDQINDAYSVDIVLNSNNESSTKSLNKLTFRMIINWTN